MMETATALPIREGINQMMSSRLQGQVRSIFTIVQKWMLPDAEESVDEHDAFLADGFIHP
jgi:hypothetical protein